MKHNLSPLLDTIAQVENKRLIATLRVSIARVAQSLGVQSPLVCDGQGNALPYEALQEAAEQERGWNALLAECVEKADQLKVSAQTAAEGTATVTRTLKETLGFVEAWQCHLSDIGSDKAAATVGDVLARARRVAGDHSTAISQA